MPAAIALLTFSQRHPELLHFHRWSLLPDEMFFQTALLNDPSHDIRASLVNNCLRYIDWDNPNPSSPATITEKHFEHLKNSSCLFGRKFDTNKDSLVLDKIDAFRADEEVRLRGEKQDSILRQLTYSETNRSQAGPNTKGHLFAEGAPTS
jgi:hypothetical protein